LEADALTCAADAPAKNKSAAAIPPETVSRIPLRILTPRRHVRREAAQQYRWNQGNGALEVRARQLLRQCFIGFRLPSQSGRRSPDCGQRVA
jgi:hypothetical protein